MNNAAGFEFRTRVKFLTAPTGQVELGRRYRSAGAAGDGERSWYLRLNADRTMTFASIRADTGAATSSFVSPAVPGAFTDDIWYGFRIDFASGKGVVQFRYSLDGVTWTNLGTALDTWGTSGLMKVSDCPLEIPSPTSSMRGSSVVGYAGMLALDGTPTATADMANTWPEGASSYTDAQGIVWTLQGSAAAITRGQSSWVTDDFDVAGPRIGYNQGSNYIAGMAYPQPCAGSVGVFEPVNAFPLIRIGGWRRSSPIGRSS